MEQVSVQKITHSYDGVRPAVAELSFHIKAGEVLALIGPNGAGKSTSLRILATLQRPDVGTVTWDGRDAWADRQAIRQRIGFLGDGTALYPNMTAAGYLRFFAECYGMSDSDAKDRVVELLEVFKLTSKAEAQIADLSKGMRQRLAIARTLVHRPELLLLDEPADGLDPLGRRQLREILRGVANDGVGIVVSSHILRELDGFCDTVALIQKGAMQVFGPVEDVIEKYEVTRRVHEVSITAGLQKALEILRGVAKQGVGIVVSSHILRELDGFCDTVALIQKGAMQVFGPVEDVIEKYEVARRVHEVSITAGLQKALEILRAHEGLIESVTALSREEKIDPATTDRGKVRVRIHGADERAAKLLKELVLADVEVIALTRMRSDLEDVYQSIGRDEVS